MDTVRRRRGGPLGRLRDEADDLFGRLFDDWGWPLARSERGAWWPALDIAEHEDVIVVKAELPGMTGDDIEISVTNNVLSISGEKKELTEEKEENYYHVERRYGQFRRDVNLPTDVDAEKVEATYRDGVLTVKVPKSEKAKPRRIEIKK